MSRSAGKCGWVKFLPEQDENLECVSVWISEQSKVAFFLCSWIACTYDLHFFIDFYTNK